MTKGLGFVRVGNVLRIAPSEVLKAEDEIRLQERRNREKLEDLEVKLLPVNYAKVEDSESLVKRLLSSRGTVNLDKRTNTLIIKDISSVIDEASALIAAVDTQTPQVMIEAKIVEVTYDSDFQIGNEAEWFNPADTNTFFRRLDQSFNPDAFLQSIANRQQFQGSTFDFRVLGHETQEFSQVAGTLRTLISRGNAEILSSPRLLVANGHPAEIVTGQDVPIQNVQLRGDQTFITTSFKPVGISLKVTPHLIAQRSVDLQVFAEVSTVTGFTQPGPLSASNPIISKRNVKTRVSLRDGETLIIGGLLRNESLIQERGIPILADLPVVGFLFKSYRRTQRKQELIFFLTPYIRERSRVMLPPRERRR
jgi:type IV pilus assembly protein PilQ